MAEMIGAEVGAAHRELEQRLMAELQALRDEVVTLRAEVAVRSEIDQLRTQMAVLRDGRMVDVTPEPRRAATEQKRLPEAPQRQAHAN